MRLEQAQMVIKAARQRFFFMRVGQTLRVGGEFLVQEFFRPMEFSEVIK
jgi:hypothetical protein